MSNINRYTSAYKQRDSNSGVNSSIASDDTEIFSPSQMFNESPRNMGAVHLTEEDFATFKEAFSLYSTDGTYIESKHVIDALQIIPEYSYRVDNILPCQIVYSTVEDKIDFKQFMKILTEQIDVFPLARLQAALQLFTDENDKNKISKESLTNILSEYGFPIDVKLINEVLDDVPQSHEGYVLIDDVTSILLDM